MRTIPRQITINPILNGYLVKVGCQTLAFNDGERMIRELSDYLRSPEEVEKRFRENALHKDMINDLLRPEATPTDDRPTDCCQQAQNVGAYPTQGLGQQALGQLCGGTTR